MRRSAANLALLLALLMAFSAPARAADGPQVDDWESLAQVYDYDAAAPLDAEESEPADAGAWTSQTVSYNGAEGLRVPGLLLRPKDVEKPPCVLFLHGYGGDKSHARLMAALLAPQGMAVFAIDAVMHGERAEQGRDFFSAELFRDRRPIVRTIVDNRRAIDYLQTREDLDADQLGLVGVSMGGIFGSILEAVDERIDAPALIVAGGRWDLLLKHSALANAQRLRNVEIPGEMVQQAMQAVEPVNFVGHISPRPVLMVNGEQDIIIPRVSAEALHSAANDPKQVIWYPGGHINVPPDVIGQVVQWLAEHCGAGAAQPVGAAQGVE